VKSPIFKKSVFVLLKLNGFKTVKKMVMFSIRFLDTLN